MAVDVDPLDVFEAIRNIQDPEFPNTLEQLAVVREDLCAVDQATRCIRVEFQPTVPHCSMASQIGLCIRVRLNREFPTYKVDVFVAPGKHHQERERTCSPGPEEPTAIDNDCRRLNDKERVVCALENPACMEEIERCLRTCE